VIFSPSETVERFPFHSNSHKIAIQLCQHCSNMMSVNIVVIAFLILVHCMSTVAASECIGSFNALRKLEVARGNNNSIPVTYVICPNTVFDMAKTADYWEMNGNTNYLCGSNGSSKNNCIVTGGDVHFLIYFYALDQSSKENILVSGFTFEKAASINGQIGYWGKHTIRDCIFRVSAITETIDVFVTSD
jgi:hypothetical protein